MNEDIVPELISSVQKSISALLDDNRTLKELRKTILSESATYKDVAEYAREYGEIIKQAMSANVTSATLPDGKMYWNIADRLFDEIMQQEFDEISTQCKAVQSALNEAADLHIVPQVPDINADRIKGLKEYASGAEWYDDVRASVENALVTFSQAVVDDSVKKNADFQAEAGLHPRIIRRAAYGCCKWCTNLSGSYNYPEDTPEDVFRRHANCNCIVEYYPGDGRRQNVWTKSWKENSDSAILSMESRNGTGDVNHQFQSSELLQQHFEKHQYEFGNISVDEYLEQASRLADEEVSDDLVELRRSDNSISRYKFSTNEFIVVNEDGTIRTYFKPERKEEYWKYEIERN